MKNILIVVALVLIVTLIFYFVKGKKPADNNGADSDGTDTSGKIEISASGFISYLNGLFGKDKGESDSDSDSPEKPSMADLDGFDEGEDLIYKGFRWRKQGDDWVLIS